MPAHVYANGREIACQAADGTAPAAFPDPCVSPDPVVIPYANFTSAPKIRNGSRTVFIKGKPVALADKSYFVTSTGNEPATPGLRACRERLRAMNVSVTPLKIFQ